MADEYSYNDTDYTFNDTDYTFNSLATETLDQTTTETRNENGSFGDNRGDYFYASQSVTQGIAGPITKISITVRRGSAATGKDYYCAIYSDDGSGNPDTRISDTTTFDVTGYSTSEYVWTDYTITGCNSISVGTKVHAVFWAEDVDGEFVRWGGENSNAYADGAPGNSPDGSSWTINTSNREWNLKTYVTG